MVAGGPPASQGGAAIEEQMKERANGFWKRIGKVFSGKPGFKEERVMNRARFSKDSRRMRLEKRPFNLNVLKLYMAFATAVSMKS